MTKPKVAKLSCATGVEAVEVIISSFKYLTEEINDLPSKPYLKASIVSHIYRETCIPVEFIQEVVNVLFNSYEI